MALASPHGIASHCQMAELDPTKRLSVTMLPTTRDRMIRSIGWPRTALEQPNDGLFVHQALVCREVYHCGA